MTVVWRGLDAPRMEVAHIASWERARGTQIGLTYELRWELEGDRLRVELVDGLARELTLGDADFFDLHDSPFFNSLPVMRDGLLDSGPPREYRMCFVRRPELSGELSRQRYIPRGNRVVGYQSDGFEADIEFGADGLVTLYHGYLERLA